MAARRAEYLEAARREPYQHLADSPTVKHYTRWSVFEERLNAPDSRAYPEPPGWLAGAAPGLVVLAGEARASGDLGGLEFEDLGRDYDVLEDIEPQGRLDYYHAARLTGAARIRVPPGLRGARLAVASLGGDGYTGHHLVIEAGEGSEAELVLVDLGGAGGSSIKTLTARVVLHDGAKLVVYALSRHGSSAVYRRIHYTLHGASGLELRALYTPGASSRIMESLSLEGSGASARVEAGAVAWEGEWGDVLFNAVHRAPRSRSSIDGRGAVLDGGGLTLRGVAIVEGQAEWSATRVDLRILTLGERARGNAAPMLEIHTGNVEEAYHSTSISSIGEEELFYMQSRGLSPSEARGLLLEGIASYPGVLERLGLTLGDLRGAANP